MVTRTDVNYFLDVHVIRKVFSADGTETVIFDNVYPAKNKNIYRYYRKFTGSVTPNFRDVPKRNLPNLGYTLRGVYMDGTSKRRAYSDLLSSTTQEDITSNYAFENSFWPSDYGDSIKSQCRYAALQRLSKSVNDVKFNAGIAFAERAQTANLIASTAHRIAAAAACLKRGNVRGLYESLGLNGTPGKKEINRIIRTSPDKRLANHWLEYNFGVVPLLNDVYGAAETLASHATGDFYHTEARASAKGSLSDKWVSGSVTYTRTQEGVYRFGIRYRLDSYSKAALAQTGISNPLSVAWEILPYSFVVDWFIPVSGYLSTLYAFDGFVLDSGWESYKWEAWLEKDLRISLTDGTTFVLSDTGWCRMHEWFYERKILTSFPSQAFPSFRNPLDNGPLWKVATSLALMRQLFKGNASFSSGGKDTD